MTRRVDMTRRKFSREFKIEAVRLVTDRGVAVGNRCLRPTLRLGLLMLRSAPLK
jgi:hypothetical protein